MMNKIVNLASLLLLVALVTSCASSSKDSSSSDQKAKEFTASQDRGSVYVYRTKRAVGAAIATQIKVNGMDAGGTGPGTYFQWELQPGTYAFSAATPESSAVVELQVEAGKIYFIRQDERLGLSSGRVTMVEVDEKTGQAAVKKLKKLVSTYRPE